MEKNTDSIIVRPEELQKVIHFMNFLVFQNIGFIQKKMEELYKQGKNYSNKTWRCTTKRDILMNHQVLQDIWTDINAVRRCIRKLSVPYTKTRNLVKRIILTSSDTNDLVFDCFMGSGTTPAVAMKLGRRFIAADINLGAIQTTTKRLINIAAEFNNKEKKLVQEENEISTFYTGFSVYNVNHYDVFRNPVQAKELLIEALEIQPLPASTIYDGEKDGRLVKIMPVNRIATRADLNELITNFDYKTFEKRAGENPGKPVEKILLVCMGHEPDLSAHLKKKFLLILI